MDHDVKLEIMNRRFVSVETMREGKKQCLGYLV